MRLPRTAGHAANVRAWGNRHRHRHGLARAPSVGPDLVARRDQHRHPGYDGDDYLFLAYADIILRRIGQHGIDAATRIVGFFVAAMGMGLIFHGVTEAIRTYVLAGTH
jgi:hypothetical protein